MNVNTQTLAECLGVSKRQIGKLTEDGVIVRVSRGSYDLGVSIKGYIEFRIAGTKSKRAGRSLESVKTEHELLKMRKTELHVKLMEGQLHRAKDVEQIWTAMAAASKGQWASSVARQGIWHKTGMIIVVMVSGGADLLISTVLTQIPAIQLPIAYSGMLCPIVLCWYIITELGSIVENAATLGAPVPSWLLKLLAVGESALENAGDLIAGEDKDNDNEQQ